MLGLDPEKRFYLLTCAGWYIMNRFQVGSTLKAFGLHDLLTKSKSTHVFLIEKERNLHCC